MTDNQHQHTDEELLQMFFESNQVEIADDGFSRRVMSALPSRSMRLNRIWTLVCWAVGIVAFITCKGWNHLAELFINMKGNFIGAVSSMEVLTVSPLVVWVSLMILSLLAFYETVKETA